MRHQRLQIVTSLLLLFFCVALSAHAAEEGGNAATERANEIFKWINFAIVAAVLVWLFAKKLPPWFRGNADKISSAITKATAAREEAERQVREAEAKQEGERLRALAQSDAKKVGVAAQAEIEAAERAARLELKALAASLAVDGAETLLAKQLTPSAQETLVDSFVKSLEGRPN
jgi:F0F1-type ATP synthase membrane subunit b/b'